MLGFEIGPDDNIPLTALDTKSQIIAAKRFRRQPGLAWEYHDVRPLPRSKMPTPWVSGQTIS